VTHELLSRFLSGPFLVLALQFWVVPEYISATRVPGARLVHWL